MGCGNSSPATSNHSSSNTGGRAESSSKISEESMAEDDKRKNYGGVYVGFPADLSNTQVQIGSLREHETDPLSLRRPLWADGF
ncbi:overexpressed in colon carcinoma 1 protein homolog [Anarrhichthys ocellatus]|uniref:overexpressed in colon carcinoma 1 protein homolog n=1 Tax=Anarrhichthys ocellatus TaxID=433405 RepID=UPI0012EDE0BD|nr:overexpressed in colon carcinoma 1 protein homolog [Anarrhichthys ocellatus]XP_031714656.1 overexpressed in colon carcinoma 1 protein homolog [Anarrhichthys ocellatus]